MKSGIIFNIQKFCIHDGDGIRTCVFMKGCPLRCIWCHNPESLDKKPILSFDFQKCTLCGRCLADCGERKIENEALSFERENCSACGKCVKVCLNGANEIIGKEMTISEIMTEVMKDKAFYDSSSGGLTLTGGEPSYQPEFALALISAAKEKGVSVSIETCGVGSAEFYESAADMGVTFLYDLKCIDPERHRKFTNADNSAILRNLKYLMSRGADIIIRIPLIPECNDSDEDIALLCEFLNENNGKYRYAQIMPYHTLGIAKAEKTGKTPSFVHESASNDDISRWRSLFELHGVQIKVSD